MYNPILTAEPPRGTMTLKRGFSLLTDVGGRVIGSISKKEILDLNGRVIAVYEKSRRVVGKDGKKQKQRVYSSHLGEMYCVGRILHLKGEPIASIPARERSPLSLAMLCTATLMMAAVLGLVQLIDLPYAELPVIEMADKNGPWSEQATIAVLDETIAPGTSGEYEFVLNNPHNISILYDFSIIEIYNGESVDNFPMEFRLRMNNVLLETEEWLDASELVYTDMEMLPNSTHSFTLEWRWRFDGGDDSLDTYFGESNGEYSLQFQMTAESVEE